MGDYGMVKQQYGCYAVTSFGNDAPHFPNGKAKLRHFFIYLMDFQYNHCNSLVHVFQFVIVVYYYLFESYDTSIVHSSFILVDDEVKIIRPCII